MSALRYAIYILIFLSLLPLPAWTQTLEARPLPSLTQSDPKAWFNSKPLRVQELHGSVVLIDFWTSDCWNCYRSFPWLKELEHQMAGRGFRVVGIHSPEFEHEKDRDRVAAKIKEFGLEHPVMMDNDMAYWMALHNRYWPSYYLVDKQGRLRYRFIGETHTGDAHAKAIRQAVETLLAE